MNRIVDALRATAVMVVSAGVIFAIILYVLVYGIDDENEYMGGDDD